MVRTIRVSAKAVIILDGRLLVTRNRDEQGDFFLLPGGGQDPGETLPEALRRECREEVGADVQVEDIVLVRDYIGRNHEFADTNSDVHQLEIMFRCSLLGDAPLGNGPSPDAWQTGIDWLDVRRLDEARLYPTVLKRVLPELEKQADIYVGDVN